MMFQKKIAKIKRLLEKKASINFQDTRNDTPLHIAVRKKQPKVLEFLVENGASVDIKNNMNKSTMDIAKMEDMKSILNSRKNRQICVEGQSANSRKQLDEKERFCRSIDNRVKAGAGLREFLDIDQGRNMYDIVFKNKVRSNMSSILHKAGAKSKDAFVGLYNAWFDEEGNIDHLNVSQQQTPAQNLILI